MTPDIASFRSTVYRLTRDFFSHKGYLEVETPILSPALIPESAIEVFETFLQHPDRSPLNLYMIPSPEIWMKHLLAQGWPSLFQITKSFRNAESLGRLHNPEFTLLEYYTVHAGYLDSIEITEAYVQFLLSNLSEQLPPEVAAALTPPFPRLRVEDAFYQHTGIELAPLDREALIREAKRIGMDSSSEESWESVFNRIFVDRVEPNLSMDRPLFLLDYPTEVRCLAKRIPDTPWRERWELYISGVELANCFTEETDPFAVQTFFEQEGREKERARVPHRLSTQFRDMYKRGFPPCSGVALGMDRLLMVLSGKTSIEGVILFPLSDTLRHEF